MFQEILSDSSVGKQSSHGRLRNFVDKHGEKALSLAYKKDSLIALCQAYQVQFNSRATKQVLATLLMQAVRINNYIPEPLLVDNRYAVVETTIRSADDGEQHIVLRLRANSTTISTSY